MRYNSSVLSINGAKIEFEFFADNTSCGQWDRTPVKGETWVRFRRHYAEHWIDAGKVEIEYGL